MEQQNFSEPTRPKLNIRLIVVLGLFLVVVFVVIVWLTHTDYPSYTITQTPFNAARSPGTLQGKDVYSYNGLAFTKTNVDTGDITVLQQGMKLPEPQNVYWAGSHGALMTFSGSFPRTKVEEALQARGEEVDEATQNYVWYVDFASSSVHLVSETPLSQAPVAYSEKDKGFYYIPDFTDVESDTYSGAVTPLHFYNIDSRTDTKIVEDLALTNFTSMNACPDIAMKVCIVARDRSNQRTVKLVGVDANNKTSTLLETSDGRIFATNSPNLYLKAESATNKPSTANDRQEQLDEDMVYGDMTPVLHDLKAKTTTTLSFTVSDEDIFPYITSSKNYYVIVTNTAAEGQGNTYLSAAPSTTGNMSSKALELVFPDNKKYRDGITEVAGYGDDQVSLLTTPTGTQLLFSPASHIRKVTGLNVNEIKSAVDKCKAGSTVDYFSDDQLFKIYFNDDSQFDLNIKKFSDCVAQNKKALLGYDFYFGGIDPTSGRYTTN